MPDPCLFSRLVRDCWPAGLARSKRTAAAENAHVRGAGPLCVPAVPERFPADACVPLTRRQDERQSGTRGKRVLACMA